MKKAVLMITIISLLFHVSCSQHKDVSKISENSQEGFVVEQSNEVIDIETYMALNTEHYKDKPVGEFDNAFEPYQHIYTGYGQTHPHIEFMESLLYAKMQLTAMENNETPYLTLASVGTKSALNYILYWDIQDINSTTVGQRDTIIKSSIERVNEIYTPYADGEKITTDDIQELLDEAGKELSSDIITIRIVAESME